MLPNHFWKASLLMIKSGSFILILVKEICGYNQWKAGASAKIGLHTEEIIHCNW